MRRVVLLMVFLFASCGGGETDRLLDPFFESVREGDIGKVKSMLAQAPDLAVAEKTGGLTALHQAAWSGNKGIIDLLLESGAEAGKKTTATGVLGSERIIGFRRVVSPVFGTGTTPLHVAAHGGHLEAVQALLTAGAELNAADSAGNSPLEMAARADQIPVLVGLLGAGADFKGQGFSELWAALMLRDVDGALQNLKAEVAGAEKSQFDRPDINRTEGRHRLLHWAVIAGAEEVVRELLRLGADVNSRNHYFETALHEAAARGALEIADVLIRNKADLNPRSLNQPAVEGLRSDYTPLHFAVVFGHLDVTKLLIKRKAHLNARDEEGWTPLHWGVSLGSMESIKLLLGAGADLQRTTRVNRTALHLAAGYGQLAAAKMLLKSGLKVNETDRDKNTPLHLSVSGEFVDVTKFLLDSGADPDALDGHGKSPRMLALESSNSELIAAFEEPPA